MLKLSSQSSGRGIEKLLGPNETEVVLRAQDGLMENLKYMCTVTAINSVGNATSKLTTIILCKSDVIKFDGYNL